MLGRIRLVICAIMELSLLSALLYAQEKPLNQTAQALHDLFASEWDYQMEQYPTWASRLGDRRWNDRWGDRSLDAIEKRHAHATDVLSKLNAMDRATLSSSDQLNYDLFLKDHQDEVDGYRYRWYLIPLN